MLIGARELRDVGDDYGSWGLVAPSAEGLVLLLLYSMRRWKFVTRSFPAFAPILPG